MKTGKTGSQYPAYILARISRLRDEKKISQETAAGYLGVTQQTYSSYERGEIKMHIDEFVRLARLFDVSVDFITGASNLREEYPKF